MHRLLRTSLFVALLLLYANPVSAQSGGTARAVLFYSPTCPHCHEVIQNQLPGISGNYNTEVTWSTSPLDESPEPALVAMQGDRLEIIFINTATELGSQLYLNAIERFDIPENRRGVPALYFDEGLLVGAAEISAQLPGLIDSALAAGGNNWPDIPGLEEQIGELVPVPMEEATPAGESASPEDPSETPVLAPDLELDATDASMMDKVFRDPVGNTASIIVLIGMLFSLVGVVFFIASVREDGTEAGLPWLVPILVILGALVAGYLSFIELTGNDAVCGPVGDCNLVQQSPYAKLFGFIPVGLLGLAGYAAIFIAWLIARFTSGRAASVFTVTVFVAAFLGTIVSIYLTFLEPFIIGATCAWCLSSAIIMTIIMWLTARPAALAVKQLRT
jgi:uncharacterized membrane protein